jgi:hypothetical protein
VRRRRFLGVLVSLPVIGAAAGPAQADARAGRAVAAPAVELDESMAATLWGYLDHASTWDEAVADLRRYVADGHADGDMFAAVADAIERELAPVDGEPLAGTLGFFPGVVLMLNGLRSVRLYGDQETAAAQAAFIARLMEVV